MFKKPEDLGTIHFSGIGGIGMSGIAEILYNLGYHIQGSDLNQNPNTERLQKLGVKIFIGQKEENLEGVKLLVISSAIQSSNPEMVAARDKRIPIIKRSEMLAELMRLKNAIAVGGTHGKTTTTALIGHMLEASNLKPTVINGGIVNAQNTNAWLGESEWMVVESDESDGSFTRLPAQMVVVTNIDPEHLEHYGSFEHLKDCFDQFVNNIPFYGLAALCVDHPEVQAMISRIQDRRIVTYGFSPQADIRADNIRPDEDGFLFDVIYSDKSSDDPDAKHKIEDFILPMYGKHNVQNSLAAIAIALEIGFDPKTIQNALSTFSGVKRRFTITGKVNDVTIVDDYGHHPIEIAAVLDAARQASSGKIHAIIQPHRYSRLSNLFEEFSMCAHNADSVYISEIYAANEEPLPGVTKEALVEEFKKHGHKDACCFNDPSELAALIGPKVEPGDFVLFFGAGTITKWANAFPKELETFYAENAQKAG